MTTRRILNKDIEPHTCTLNADGGNEELLHPKISVSDDKASYSETLKAELLNRVEIAEEKKLHPINFDGIIGHEDLKQEIILAVFAKLNEDEESKSFLKSIRDHATTGILIYGLPGVGKSDVLRQIGESVKDNPDIDCKYMSCSDFQGNVGTNAKRIDDVFDEARLTTKKCCIMLIDEIDSVMMSKKHGYLNVAERTNAMQSNMDGVKDSSKIIVIATTNRVNAMEDASISRFTRINLELPGVEERKQLIKMYISSQQCEPTIDFNEIANITCGFTGRMFRDIAKKINRIRMMSKKPLTEDIILREMSKYMTQAGRNKAKMHEDEDGNCLKQENVSYSNDKDTSNKRELLTLDSENSEQSRLNNFKKMVEESKKTPIVGV